MELGFERLRAIHFDFTLASVRAIADTWEIVIALAIIMLLLNLFARKKQGASGSFFAVVLLIGRKAAVYIPVVGTMSSADRVVFWSVGAFIYFALIILIFLCLALAIMFYDLAELRKKKLDPVGVVVVGTMYLSIGALIGSGIFLPVDGWCHLYMPVLALLGLVKVLFVSPLLLPIACLTLLIHLFLILSGQRAAVREINKLAIILLLIGGGVEFAYQILNFKDSQIISDIRNSWTTQQPGGKSSLKEETSDFLVLWAENIGEIHRSGINMVGKSPDLPAKPVSRGAAAPAMPPRSEVLRDSLAKLPDPWREFRRRFDLFIPLVSAGILLFLMIGAERVRLGDEQELFAGNAPGRSLELNARD